jgi:hypothetical protein
MRVSALMAIASEIQELDINPLKALEHAVLALDVRVRVGRRDARPPTHRIAY